MGSEMCIRDSNRTVREELERGVFDVNSVRKANENLIATIEESLEIADEGKRRRVEAEKTLVELEDNLKDTLKSAEAKARNPSPTSAG